MKSYKRLQPKRIIQFRLLLGMKRFNLFLMAILLMGGVVMAQDSRRGDKKDVTPEVRAQRMTDRMVKEYSLNEKQAKELQAANLELVKQMQVNKEQAKAEKRQKREDMKSMRDAREAQLKKILTTDQYTAYQKKQAEREKGMKGKGNPRHKNKRG